MIHLLTCRSSNEERLLTARSVMNPPERLVLVVPGSHHHTTELCLQLVFEVGDVPVLQVMVGVVTLQC